MEYLGQFDENFKLKTIFSKYYNLIYSKQSRSSYRYGLTSDQDAIFGFFGPEIVYLNCMDNQYKNVITFEQFINIFHKIVYSEYFMVNKKGKIKSYFWNDKIKIKRDNKNTFEKVFLKYYQSAISNINDISCVKQSALYRIILLADCLDDNIYKIIDYLKIYGIDIEVLLYNKNLLFLQSDINKINNYKLPVYILYEDSNSFKHNMLYQCEYLNIWCQLTSKNIIDVSYNLLKYKHKFWYFYVSQYNKQYDNLYYTNKRQNKTKINNIIDICFKNKINFTFDQSSSDYLFSYISGNKSISEENKKIFKEFIPIDESGLFNCVINKDGELFKSLADMSIDNKVCNIFNFKDFINDVWLKYFLK